MKKRNVLELAKMVIDCADPNDMEAVDRAVEKAIGGCDITYLKQDQSLQAAGRSKNLSQSAKIISDGTGEKFETVRTKMRRGKNKIDHVDRLKPKPQLCDAYKRHCELVDMGTCDSERESARFISRETGEAADTIRSRIFRGKNKAKASVFTPKWLEEHNPELVDKYKTYEHILPGGMIVDARQYENDVLPHFIEFIETEWIPNRSEAYFKKRDIVALPFLPKLLPPP